MSVETLQNISRICLIIAVVVFLASILLFFLFNIPKLFSELTGRDARKFIAEAKKKNEETQSDTFSGTSESLLSSELVSERLSDSQKTVTTKLIPLKETTRLPVNPLVKNVEQIQQNSGNAIPVVHPDVEFSIIEEFSFTSSTEIIE
ncbi:MAG: hypothetical protein K2O42_04675 [Oscillospiraceae bacterium]|nr:hypothetical protein [Oscillospiraceae bacterium]